MSLPNTNTGQSSIRNFFRPKQPIYTSPPSASKTAHKKKNTSLNSSPALPLLPTSITPTTTTAATAATAVTAVAPPSRPANLHPQASIECVQPEHVQALRRITSLLLPVNYPDSFYARLSDPLSSGAFSRVIIWRDSKDGPAARGKVIGGLVCRPEPSPFHAGTVDSPRSRRSPTASAPQPNALYIQSLVLLSPYRGLGLAAALLDEVVADAARSTFACKTVWAHVWTENDDALRWYTARGFTRVEEVKSYYHKLQPDSAWIVRREIGPSAVLGLENSSSHLGEINPTGPSNSVTAAVASLPSAPSPTPTTTTTPNPTRPNSTRSTPGQSFQNTRPETEWNDLPSDMQVSKPSSSNLSVPATGSSASSRSSSTTGRKRRDRAYPAAAFGNQTR
ncbi:acyl-CoA N-acyltransferase [Xylaria intraflava]|nr:acyl-CoA N-acyltransferase [Xylaria intraflava]